MARKPKEQKIVPSHRGEIHSMKPWYALLYFLMMWIGFFVGLFSWMPWETVLGINKSILGIVGGTVCIAGVFLLMLNVKCPACGNRNLGKAMGLKPPKKCECPDCHATVELEWKKK